MIDTLQSAMLPKGMAEDVVVSDCTAILSAYRSADRTVARASDLAPLAGTAGSGRPAAHGSFGAVLAPRPWVAGAGIRAIRC